MLTPSLATPNLAPPPVDDRAEVLAGLRRPQKELPSKLFYDARGSELFDAICQLEAYYPTRTEIAIMRRHLGAIADRLGPRCLLIEYGSGSSVKTRLLLDRLVDPAGYIPIDISGEHLRDVAARLARDYPAVRIVPLEADYSRPLTIPAWPAPVRRRVVYFPGSTIGNFQPHEAVGFLDRMARTCGPGGGVLIGVDLKKDVAIVERAYNDPEGVTAAFNLNVLARLNREMGAGFDLGQFVHRAPYNAALDRIEMHLVSRSAQVVPVAGADIAFDAGESILTEYAYKYDLDGFAALARRAGLGVEDVWTDDRGWFSVQYLTATG